MSWEGRISQIERRFSWEGVATRKEWLALLLGYFLFILLSQIPLVWVFYGYINDAIDYGAQAADVLMADDMLDPIIFYGSVAWYFVIVASFFLFFALLLGTASRRLRDSGQSNHWAWLLFVPIVGQILILILCFLPSKTILSKSCS